MIGSVQKFIGGSKSRYWDDIVYRRPLILRFFACFCPPFSSAFTLNAMYFFPIKTWNIKMFHLALWHCFVEVLFFFGLMYWAQWIEIISEGAELFKRINKYSQNVRNSSKCRYLHINMKIKMWIQNIFNHNLCGASDALSWLNKVIHPKYSKNSCKAIWADKKGTGFWKISS